MAKNAKETNKAGKVLEVGCILDKVPKDGICIKTQRRKTLKRLGIYGLFYSLQFLKDFHTYSHLDLTRENIYR